MVLAAPIDADRVDVRRQMRRRPIAENNPTTDMRGLTRMTESSRMAEAMTDAHCGPGVGPNEEGVLGAHPVLTPLYLSILGEVLVFTRVHGRQGAVRVRAAAQVRPLVDLNVTNRTRQRPWPSGDAVNAVRPLDITGRAGGVVVASLANSIDLCAVGNVARTRVKSVGHDA